MTAPLPLAASRFQAIVDAWIAVVGGARGERQLCGRLADVIPATGSWTQQADGLWLETSSSVGAASACLPIDVDAKVGGTGARVVAHMALVWVASTAAAAQPKAEVLIVNSSGVTVATGSTKTATANIGWQVLSWTGGTPAAIAANDCAMVRVTNGASGDRVAAVMAALTVPA